MRWPASELSEVIEGEALQASPVRGGDASPVNVPDRALLKINYRFMLIFLDIW